MRPIKFRSWNGKNFEYFNNGKCDCAFGWGEAQQFTGLVDKHGVEIYEGDLIQLGKINGKPFYGEVIFDNAEDFGVPCFCILSQEGHKEVFFDVGDEPRVWFEVIGNIYEHSHLLDS